MGDRFYHEDDVEAAYEAAEMVLTSHIDEDLLLTDERKRRETIRRIARQIADAVIRSDSDAIVSGDITDIPGVKVEHVG